MKSCERDLIWLQQFLNLNKDFWCFLLITKMNRKFSKSKLQLDEAILEANMHHPHRWPRGLISELAKIHNTSPSSVFKRRESLCGFVRTNQGPIEVDSGMSPPSPIVETQLSWQMRHISNPLGDGDDRSSFGAKVAPPQDLENRDLAMEATTCYQCSIWSLVGCR